MPGRAVRVREQKARAEAVLSEPDVLDAMCAYVADGGSLIDLCQEWEIRHSDAVAWLYAQPARKAAYEFAVKARGEWMVERLLSELRAIAFSDLRQAFGPDGALLPPGQWPEGLARAISAVEQGEAAKIKVWDKPGAIKMLGSTMRMFLDQREQTPLEETLEALVLRSMEPRAIDVTPVLALPAASEAQGVTSAPDAVEPATIEGPPPQPRGFGSSSP